MKSPLKLLESIYSLFFAILLFLIITTNHLITSDFQIFKNVILREEYLESILIAILFFIGYLIFTSYRKEIVKKEKLLNSVKKSKYDLENELNNSFKYIGQVNVQIQEIKKVLIGLKKFPENKVDLKNILNFLTNKTLAIVNVDWALLRILDINNQQTLKECSETRGDYILLKHQISNQMLINNEKFKGYSIVTSEQNNLTLKAYFIFPIKKLKEEQRILIKAIINELEMIFLIFNSKFYHDRK